jgi:hypothetical protein
MIGAGIAQPVQWLYSSYKITTFWTAAISLELWPFHLKFTSSPVTLLSSSPSTDSHIDRHYHLIPFVDNTRFAGVSLTPEGSGVEHKSKQ